MEYDGRNPEPKVGKDPVDQESFASNLIGIQFCSPNKGESSGFPGYLFIDVQGPVTFDEYGLRLDSFMVPRVGVGLQF